MGLESTCELIYGYDIKLPGGVVEVRVYKGLKSSFVDVQYIGDVPEEIRDMSESSLRNSEAKSIHRYSGARN